jgi:hypothetical protein
VSKCLRRAHRGVKGGAEPPARGFGGSAPDVGFREQHPRNFFFFFSGRHIFGTT